MAGAYSDSILEGKSPQYAYALAILSGGIAFVVAQLGDTVAVWFSYALLAALFASIWPYGSWQWAGWLCLPILMLLCFDLVSTGSFQRLLLNGMVFAKALPFACLGVYVGSKLSIRRLMHRHAGAQVKHRNGKHVSSNESPFVLKEHLIPAAPRKPVFSVPRHEEHIRRIEPASPSQSPTASLIKAVREGDLDKIGLLAAQGVDINAMSEDECTPLMIAALGGDAEMVGALFGEGAALNAAGCKGRTALMVATIEGHAEVVRALIEHGAQVDAVNNRGWTALRYAVSMDETEILRLLIEAKADVNLADAEGQTALMQAAGEDSVATIKALLDAGADPHIKDKKDETALMIARERGHNRSIRLLKEAVAKASPRVDSEGCLQCDGDSYLYLLKEELEEKLSQRVTPAARGAEDVAVMLHSALQTVQEQINSARKERLLAPSELSHKLLLTVREASTLSGLPRQHLIEAIEGKTLKAQLIKDGWRISRAALDDYIRRLK